MRDFYLRENRVSVFIYVFLLIVLTIPNYISNTEADVIPLGSTGAGNFIPKEDCSLIMTNASVTFEINYSKTSNKIFLSFNGNYTIYNPFESVRMTLAAPFSPELINLELTCIIKLDDNIIPFSFLEENLNLSIWGEYFDRTGTLPRKLLIIDVDFPENESIKLEYIFDAYIEIENYLNSDLVIYYDVGTSRAWNGTITERVEFNVYGDQPHSYSNSSDHYKFSISDIEDGKSYIWEWKNEVININKVYISYSYRSNWPYWFNPSTLSWILLFYVFLPVSFFLLIIIIVLLRRRHKRKIKENFAS